MSGRQTSFRSRKGPTILVIVALVIATLLNWLWIWGLLFLFWSVQSLLLGRVYLIGYIRQSSNPGLYWLITAMWAGFAFWYIYDGLPG